MSQRAINQDVRQQDFSEIVERFIARYCRLGDDLNVSDRTLFPAFRAFWIAAVPEIAHPALLGQFRVELTERGYRSNSPKKPLWYGLTLHQLTVISDQTDERLMKP